MEVKRLNLNHQPTTPNTHQNQSLSKPQFPNQVSTHWSSLIKQYVSNKLPKQGLLTYTQIRRNGFYHVGVVPLLFKACAKLLLTYHGKTLHCESIKAGTDVNIMVGTSLVDFYGKCGDVAGARKVFDNLPARNSITFNAVIGVYMRKGDVHSAQTLFEKMEIRTSVSWIEMIGGFAKNGDVVTARSLFNRMPVELKNVVAWTVMVDGYANKGEMEAAREVFEVMPVRNFYVWSSMISGYCKKGDVREARLIFDQMPDRNLVNWNSIISGYSQNGFSEEAMEAFLKMQDEGFEPDEITVVSALSACAQLGLLDSGKEIHQMITHKHIKLNHFVLNALVDMYAKCGDLLNAISIFDRMHRRSTACWNSMISGFATHGHGEEALKLFSRMEKSNEKPDDITFLTVLSACAHGGNVNEGLELLSKMEKNGITVSMKHYGCLVDLLGRAGRLKEAYDLVKTMPMKPSDVIFGALLGACQVHNDTETAERVMENIGGAGGHDVNTGDDTHYVLLSNIYAASNNWKKAERMRMVMVNKGFQKTPGHSSIMLSSCHHFHTKIR